MKTLTTEEKTLIFWSLVDKYPEHERGRIQSKMIFEKNPNCKIGADVILERINVKEQEHYDLMEKIGQDIGIKIPDKI